MIIAISSVQVSCGSPGLLDNPDHYDYIATIVNAEKTREGGCKINELYQAGRENR